MRGLKLAAVVALGAAMYGTAQSGYVRPSGKVLHDAAGDMPETAGPLDTSLSAKLTRKDVRAATAKVADWQMKQAEGKWTQDWTYAPLYSGLLAASVTTGDKRYHDKVVSLADGFQWDVLHGRLGHADDIAIGQAYESLYRENKDMARIAKVRAEMDEVMAMPDPSAKTVKQEDPKKILWWWCDALYMAPSTFAEMGKITGDRKYITFMDKQWDKTTALLYSPGDKLYYRDLTQVPRHEANGSKVFWSRGDGWVLAGAARTLSVLGKDDPLYPKYAALFKQMAEKIASLQPEDGLWRMGLLDPQAYPMGEVSGTGFFVYAMAWGVNNGLLDRTRFIPTIERGWAGMVKNVYQDGRLGAIQPIGLAPDKLTAGSSWVYGVGAFLLAGNEIDTMIARGAKVSRKAK